MQEQKQQQSSGMQTSILPHSVSGTKRAEEMDLSARGASVVDISGQLRSQSQLLRHGFPAIFYFFPFLLPPKHGCSSAVLFLLYFCFQLLCLKVQSGAGFQCQCEHVSHDLHANIVPWRQPQLRRLLLRKWHATHATAATVVGRRLEAP